MNKPLRGHALEQYKLTLVLSDTQKDILIGTLLGDASMQAMKGNAQSNVKWEQKISQLDYIWHLYEEFKPFVGTPPTVRYIIGGGAADRQSIWFKTYRHPSFAFYKNIFYSINPDGKQFKIVPSNIHELLTPRALAYWYMDDGSAKRNNGKISSFVFNTQGFSNDDQLLLLNVLKTYNFDATIFKDRNYRLLAIRSSSKEIFINTVKPYILESFLYKIML